MEIHPSDVSRGLFSRGLSSLSVSQGAEWLLRSLLLWLLASLCQPRCRRRL